MTGQMSGCPGVANGCIAKAVDSPAWSRQDLGAAHCEPGEICEVAVATSAAAAVRFRCDVCGETYPLPGFAEPCIFPTAVVHPWPGWPGCSLRRRSFPGPVPAVPLRPVGACRPAADR